MYTYIHVLGIRLHKKETPHVIKKKYIGSNVGKKFGYFLLEHMQSFSSPE